MEAGEAAGALLFLLSAAAAVAAAVATGAVNFTYLVPVGSGVSPSSSSGDEWAAWREAWARVRSRAVAPALQAAAWACMVMSVMLVVEATFHSAVSLGVKLLGWKPERRLKWEPLAWKPERRFKWEPTKLTGTKKVYKLSIEAACELKWPKERLTVQVLDDSTDPFTKVKSELPSTYDAYCHQQSRWACGSANLFRKMIWEVLTAKKVSPVKKFYMIYSFFLVRRIIAPPIAFVLYSVIIPVSLMIPEIFLPIWGVAYIPTALTIRAMSMHRLKAAVSGLLELPEINQWIVTKKVGNIVTEENGEIPLLQKARKSLTNRVHLPEIMFSLFLFICASYNLVHHGKTIYYVNLYLQGVAFFLLGLNYTGTC